MGSGFRTFQSGEVLTSSNVQNYLMDQAITVFSGTAARGSAIASPETGMVSYRTDGTADSKREGFEFYDGASWTRLVPATTTAGLELISSTTIGSAVSSVTVSNVFSSTYDNYKIIVSGGAASAAGALQIRLGATTTGYYYVTVRYTYAGVASNDIGSNQAIFAPVGASSTDNLTLSCDLIAPFLAEKTSIYFNQVGPVSTSVAGAGGGFLDNTTSYTGFDLVQSTGTMTGGTIKVYGYKN